jgi:hypothetical protein
MNSEVQQSKGVFTMVLYSIGGSWTNIPVNIEATIPKQDLRLLSYDMYWDDSTTPKGPNSFMYFLDAPWLGSNQNIDNNANKYSLSLPTNLGRETAHYGREFDNRIIHLDREINSNFKVSVYQPDVFSTVNASLSGQLEPVNLEFLILTFGYDLTRT